MDTKSTTAPSARLPAAHAHPHASTAADGAEGAAASALLAGGPALFGAGPANGTARGLRRGQIRTAQQWAGNQSVQRALQRADAPATATPAAPAPAPAAQPGGQPNAGPPLSAAQAVLRAVPPLPEGEVARLAELMRQAPLYGLIARRDAKRTQLEKETTAAHEGASPVRPALLDELTAEVRQLDAQIKAALPALGVTDEAQLRQRIEHDFPALWEARARLIADSVLDRARTTVEAEQRRYAPADGGVPDDIGALKLADQHLAELVLDVEGDPQFAELKAFGGPRAARDLGGDARAGGTGGHDNAGADGSSASAEHAATHKRRAELQAALLPKHERLVAHTQRYGSQFPVLYSSGYRPGALQPLKAADVARAATEWSGDALVKIETTRGKLGGAIKLWDVPAIAHLTYQSLGVPEHSALALGVAHHRAAVKSAADAIKEALVVLGIGLGVAGTLLGGPIGAGLGAAVAAAGAGGSLLETIEAFRHYLAHGESQEMGMDPEVRAIFEHGAPDEQALLLDLVGVGLGMLAAAGATKHLIGSVRRVRAAKRAGAAAAEELEEALDELAAREASSPEPLPSGTAARLTSSDPTDVAAAVREAEATGAKIGAAARAAALGKSFKQEIDEAKVLIDGVHGRIPDFVRDWIARGRVRPMTREVLLADFGHLPPKQYPYLNRGQEMLAQGQLTRLGFYSPRTNCIYLRSGSDDQMAGALIHEATHALEYRARLERLVNKGWEFGEAREQAMRMSRQDILESELKAHAAQRDFYVRTYEDPGGLLYNKQSSASPATQSILRFKGDDAGLVDYVQRTYGITVATGAPMQERYMQYIQKSLFEDIKTHYDYVPTL